VGILYAEIATMSSIDKGRAARKTAILAGLLVAQQPTPIKRILVVGCGNGFDAGVLARYFSCSTIGIDIYDLFDARVAAPAEFAIMDARALSFADGTFDLVYSFHALEHIPEPWRALSEMKRVLRPGGTYCIGTPNRARAVGYLGTNVAWRTKLYTNLVDWCARLRGRFRNEYGAHAGFTRRELEELCRTAFGRARDLSDQYYLALYARHRRLLRLLILARLQAIAWPSVYVFGTKIADMP